MKLLSLLLVMVFLTNVLFITSANAQVVRGGILTTSEVWSGEVQITDDVVVPKNMELEIKPGTVLLYEKCDKDDQKDIPALVIYGTLKVGKTPDEIGDCQVLPLDSRTKLIKVSPYKVDTKILRDEFRIFRIQYVIIWTVLFSAVIYAIANR